MAFSNLFTPKNKKSDRELFLAVEIHESLIKTAVWQVDGETASIVSIGSYELWDSEDSLVNGIDASLTESIKGLDSQPDRVIFGLPESWLVDNKVHPTKQKIIKRIKDDLSLQPIGVVTITEAIIRHLKSQDGIPPTSILLEVYPSKVIVSLVNVGEKQAMEEVGRSDDLARDVEEGLARFEAKKLPARFILTNGSDLEDEEQQIVSYPWTEKLPFIHLPKVEVLPIDFSIRAIALSGGSEAAKSLGFEIASSEEPESAPDYSAIGFALEGEKEVVPDRPETIVNQPDQFESPPLKASFFDRFPKIRFHKPSLPTIQLSKSNIPQGLIWFVPLIMAALLISGLSGYYFYFGKVTINLVISPVRQSQSIDLAIGTAPKDGLLTIIAAKKTLSAKASGSLPTTGEALVGDRASGKVTIYNLSNQPMSLKAGAKINSASNLTFTLDSATSIASASGQFNETGPVFPSSEVNVTATKIGTESNLNKLASFSIENYPKSTLIARADADFSGGSSRTVKAVSKTDQDKLLADMSLKIKALIDEQLKKDDPNNRSLSIGTLKLTTKDFDKDIGQEASNLSLDLAADLDVLVYSQKELLGQIQNQILQTAKPGQVLSPEQTQISLTDPNPLGNIFTTKADVQAVLIPKIDQMEFIRESKGRRVSVLQNLLQTLSGFQSAKVEISPNLPLISAYLPINPDNFKFVTTIR